MSEKDLQEKTSRGSSQSSPLQSDKDTKGLRWMGLGFEFAGVLAIFSWLGYKADQKLGNEGPWLLLTGFGIGFVGMMYLVIKETFNLRK